MKKMNPLFLLALVGVAVVFLFPAKVRCGAPAKACASAPDKNGNISYYYVYEPLGIKIIEEMLITDIDFAYSSGFDLVGSSVRE